MQIFKSALPEMTGKLPKVEVGEMPYEIFFSLAAQKVFFTSRTTKLISFYFG